MLLVFFGNDTITVRQKAFAAAEKAAGRSGTALTVSGDEYEEGRITELAGETSLFGDTAIYVIDTPSTDEQFSEEVTSLLPDMAASSHTFIIIEAKLLAAQKKQFEKHAGVCEEHSVKATRDFNAFTITDALLRKDKKTMWLLLHEARRAGARDEETIGILWWQLKTLRLAALTNSAAEAGLKEYPYRKAKGALKNFSSDELERLSTDLLTIQHESRRSRFDLDLALEHWLLTFTIHQ